MIDITKVDPKKYSDLFSFKTIEVIVRYLLIGAVDVIVLRLAFPPTSVGFCFWNEIQRALGDYWLLIVIPTVGFTHYSIHRCVVGGFLENLAYLINASPANAVDFGNEITCLQKIEIISVIFSILLLSILFMLSRFFWLLAPIVLLLVILYLERATILNRLDRWASRSATFLWDRNFEGVFPPKLSNHLSHRWGFIHFNFMVLEILTLSVLYGNLVGRMFQNEKALIWTMSIYFIYVGFTIFSYFGLMFIEKYIYRQHQRNTIPDIIILHQP
jgi:hypothetical protein